MPTDYIHRWIIFVEIGKTKTANNWAKQWDPDTGGAQTFGGMRLSATGEEPATHTGCNTAATGPMTQGIQNALTHTPFAALYDGHEWAWQDALEDAGLQVIQQEELI